MRVEPAIVEEHAAQQAEPEGRAKHIRRADDPYRLQSARRFAAACEVTGTPLAAVARAWAVEEKTAREVASGAKPLTGERIEALPPSVLRAYAQSLIDDADDAAPLSRMPLSTHGLVLGRAAGATHSEIIEAEADGVVDEGERRRVLRAAAVVEASAHALVRELGRGGR